METSRRSEERVGDERNRAAPREPPSGEIGKMGKGKHGRLSSQNRGSATERERKAGGKARKRKRKGSTGGTAVGAKPGRMKGNEQEAEYENRKQGMGNQAGTNGENRESESGSGAPGKPL